MLPFWLVWTSQLQKGPIVYYLEECSIYIYIYIYILWRSGVNQDNGDNLKIENTTSGSEMMSRRLAGFWDLETKTG